MQHVYADDQKVTHPAGRAAIEIIGDTSKLASQLQRDVNKALRSLRVDTTPISKQISAGLQRGVDEGGRAFQELDDQAEGSLREIGRAVDDLFDRMGRDANGISRDFDSEFVQIAAVAEKSADSVARSFQQGGEDAEDAFRELDRAATRSLDSIARKARGASKSVGGSGREGASALGDLDKAATGAGGSMKGMEINAAALASKIDKAKETIKGLEAELTRVGNNPGLRASLRVERSWLGELEKVAKRFSDVDKSAAGAGESIKRMEVDAKKNNDTIKGLVTGLKSVVSAVSLVAAVGSTLAPLTSALLATGKAIASIGKGLASLAPLTAFIPSLVGSLALVVGTMKLAGPGLVTAFAPIKAQFVDLEGNATEITKTIQNLVSRGVEPLARAFVKVNMPTIIAAMDQIAIATNDIIVTTGEWINSAEGMNLIQTIAHSTADAFNKLSPQISAAVIALGRLANRAGDGAIVGLGNLIGKILDKFTAWADSKAMEDINAGIDKIKNGLAKSKEAFDHVKAVVDWVVANQAAIKTFSTALGVFGLIGGIVTGNPFAVLIAAMGLLLGNWKEVTAAFSDSPLAAALPGIKDAVASIVAALQPLLPVVLQVVEQVLLIAAAFAPLVAIAVKLAAALLPLLVPALQLVLAVITPLLPPITALANVLATTLIAAVNALIGPLTWLAGWLSDNPAAVWALVAAFTAYHAITKAAAAVRWVLDVVAWIALRAEVVATTAQMVAHQIAVAASAAATGVQTAAVWAANTATAAWTAVTESAIVKATAHKVAMAASAVATGAVTAAQNIAKAATLAWTAVTSGHAVSMAASTVTAGAHAIAIGAVSVATGIASVATGVWTVAMNLLKIAFITSPIGWIVLAIGGLIAIIVLIATKTTWFQDIWNKVWGGIKAAAKAVGDWFSNTLWPGIKSVFEKIGGFFSGLGDKIGGAFAGVKGILKGALNGAISLVNRAIDGLNRLIGLANHIPGVNLGTIGHIPQLATGGLTTNEGLANLHPKELVLPLEDQRAVDLLGKALAEADAGLRATGVISGEAPVIEAHFEVRNFFGDKEFTDIIRTEISESNRGLRRRVQAGAGNR